MTTVILSRAGAGIADSHSHEERVMASCASRCIDRLLVIPHLYHVAEQSPIWERLLELEGQIILLSWLHPRPAQWLLQRHGVDTAQMTLVNLAAAAPEASSDCFAHLPDSTRGESPIEVLEDLLNERWYPVMDVARCIACRHCLQFCLFGVYAEDAEGRVVIAQPDKCKPGCPACSRICPQGAIMFPLYANDPAIAGAPGCLMTADPAAKKMYYLRTKLPCPQCGRTDNPGKTDPATPVCPECGRPLAMPAKSVTPPDDLDALIDRLDHLQGGRS